MSERYDIGVLGAGAWGTALATLHAQAGRQVALWARDPVRAEEIAVRRENPRLPGVRLPRHLEISAILPRAELLLVAVPMQHLRALLMQLPPGDTPLVLCCKGLEAGSGHLPHELLAALQPGRPAAILTGPNFASEVAAGLPAAAVLATPEPGLRSRLTRELRSGTLRLYGSPDMTGAALGGAAKNVTAMAAGIVIGAGLGENARAALITRGLAAIARLAVALGGKARTVSGLSGLGDLLLTCTGTASRNYSLGLALGQGQKLPDVLRGRSGVTEGVTTAPALLARAAQVGVEMPIATAMTRLLEGQTTVAETVAVLMGRDLKDE